uniref:Zeta-coat protein n=1 Tax=Arcella intermedia TaxID=1963864 RepID=A0A6B2LKQ3_9EUKA
MPLQQNMSLYSIRAVMILDNVGNRFVAKYFPKSKDEFDSRKSQETFEKKLFDKTNRSAAEIVMFDGYLVVYQSCADVIFYVVGPQDENELILLSALNTFKDTIDSLLKGQVDKRSLLENLDYVLLTIDELVDGGILLETDSEVISSRVSLKGADGDIPLAEQTLTQAFQTAKDQFLQNLF